MKKEISRNSFCPCESGKKYKHCCFSKGVKWVKDDDGELYKQIPMNDATRKILEKQKLIKQYGREPRPEDPVFPGLSSEEMEETEKYFKTQMSDLMRKAGMDEAHIYTFNKTGLFITQKNVHIVSDRELQEWEDVVNEYYLSSSP